MLGGWWLGIGGIALTWFEGFFFGDFHRSRWSYPIPIYLRYIIQRPPLTLHTLQTKANKMRISIDLDNHPHPHHKSHPPLPLQKQEKTDAVLLFLSAPNFQFGVRERERERENKNETLG